MSVSTNAEISFGILFDEDHEFPWDDEKYDTDMAEWWRDINGYKPPFELFDERGEYAAGIPLTKDQYGRKEAPKEMVSAYFDHRHEWEKAHPLPVELVNVCSGGYPTYILAIEGSVTTAYRGSPKEISAAMLVASDEAAGVLISFCKKYGIEGGDGPKWWLSSYWG